jgi:hypothetical protein
MPGAHEPHTRTTLPQHRRHRTFSPHHVDDSHDLWQDSCQRMVSRI